MFLCRTQSAQLGCITTSIALGLLAGCVSAPPVRSDGLPKVSRYTNPAQLEFLLDRYQQLVERPESSPAATELRNEACLGWERTLFDLQSARYYPVLLRMGSDTISLASLWAETPRLASRHPLAGACVDAPASKAISAGPTATQAAVVASPAAPLASESPVVNAPVAPTAGTTTSDVAPGQGGVATAVLAPVTPAAEPMAVVDGSGAGSKPSSKFAEERRLLGQLRGALAMPIQPMLGEHVQDPTVSVPPQGPVDLKSLVALAQSEVPTIRLRARFHLLGLCTLAVEASDRGMSMSSSSVGADSVIPGDPAACRVAPGHSAHGSLRAGQRRLLKSMLAAWRSKYPEPMADLAFSLASFASRDNPVVDGPRATR